MAALAALLSSQASASLSEFTAVTQSHRAAPPSSVLAPGFVYLVLEVTVTTVSHVFVAYLLYVQGHVGDRSAIISLVAVTFKLELNRGEQCMQHVHLAARLGVGVWSPH